VSRTLRVAMSGIRGIPANFGGSETAVQEIGRRLVARGDEVTVYCRRHISPNGDRAFLGMRRVVLPSINTFNFDTISHSFLASLHAVFTRRLDVVHFHGMGNALLLPLFAPTRIKTVVTIDGPDWERPKWGCVARFTLKLGARMAIRLADHVIIDNRPSIDYFRRHLGFADGSYVPYGADRDPPSTTGHLDRYSLEPRSYVVFVGALVPDKGPDMLVDAYRQVQTDFPLVLVGDSPFHAKYRRELRQAAARDDRVRMLGYVYGDAYRELVAHAYAYVHPLRADGTSPALLQALGFGSCIVVNSLPEALGAAGVGALPFARNDVDDLARQLQRVLDDPVLAEEYRERARGRARSEYDWDRVTEQHRDIYAALSGARGA
jgi:glycosyltransferase involved in cell wall biosynthesis